MLSCLLAAAIALGCSRDYLPLAPDRDTAVALLRPALSSLDAPVGSRIAIAIQSDPSLGTLSGVQGSIRYNPHKLRFVGQTPYDSLTFPLLIVNPDQAPSGELRLLAVSPSGLTQDATVLAFDVLEGGYAASVSFLSEGAVTTAMEPLDFPNLLGKAVANRALTPPALPVRIDAENWYKLMKVKPRAGSRLIDSVPTGLKFGDVTNDGLINIIDGARVGNWAVGNQTPPGTPIPSPGDLAELAGNVRPVNGTGFGGASDDKGPGWETNCTRIWNILDAAAVSNEAVGNDQAIVGENVPSDAVDSITRLPRRGSACGGGGAAPAQVRDLDIPDDSMKVVTEPSDPRFVYYRTMATVEFKESATASQIYAFLTRYRAEIVGGTRWGGLFIVRYPDPGESWSAVGGLMALMRGDPAIETVTPTIRAGVRTLDSRFPNDGSGLRRADWINHNDSIWAFEAIRAPLAWGCETGKYGSSVTVGILDGDFEPALSDLASSVSPIAPVHRPSRVAGDTASPESKERARFHGSAMAALVSAEGDNGSGIAGMLWGSTLKLYAFDAPSGLGTAAPAATVFDILEQASLDGVRVLSFSGNIATPNDTTGIGPVNFNQIRKAFKAFHDSTPNAIIVKSTGNSGADPMSATTLASTTTLGTVAALMSLRLSSSAYADRIVFVTGVAKDRKFKRRTWDFYTGGGTDIAAPAEAVPMLGLGSHGAYAPYSHQVVLDDGTSPATALVAGVAAQLLATDPSLTPGQVKQYLLDGARSERMNETTGVVARVDSVRDAPEVVYLLDAYGSLRLLSSSNAALPICGQEVIPAYDPIAGINRLEVRRATVDPIDTPSGPVQSLWSFSVAQGGRLLAADNRIYRLGTGGTWDLLSTDPIAERIEFLERDTAYYWGVATTPTRWDVMIRIGSGDGTTFTKNVTSGLRSGSWSAYGDARSVSPTAEWAHVVWRYTDDESNCTVTPFAGLRDILVPLKTGVGSTYTFDTWDFDICAYPVPEPPATRDDDGSIAWRSDATGFFSVRNIGYRGGGGRAEFRQFTTSGGISPAGAVTSVEGVRAFLFQWHPEFGRIRHLEMSAASPTICETVERRASNPSVEILRRNDACAVAPVQPIPKKLISARQRAF